MKIKSMINWSLRCLVLIKQKPKLDTNVRQILVDLYISIASVCILSKCIETELSLFRSF